MNDHFNTPILFIIFNRLDTARRVFDEIRKIRPKQLFIAADGPRPDRADEKTRCDEVRKYVLDQIDWDCTVKTLFREENLGCGRAVSSAVTWFFQNVEKGIILEDDCLPNRSFFNFCEELLNYYKDNKRIMHIAGAQMISDFENGASYYFARIQHCWGWASWADRWRYYNFNLEKYDEKNIRKFSSDKNVQKYWLEILRKLNNEGIDTWDYQWAFKIVEKNGLCVNPSKNMISNIGFGENSTHCSNKNSPYANLPTYEIKKMIHPRKAEINQEAVDLIYRDHFGINYDLSEKVTLQKLLWGWLNKVMTNKHVNQSSMLFNKPLKKEIVPESPDDYSAINALKALDYINVKNGRVLVVGCGTGKECSYFVIAGAKEIHGVDVLENIGTEFKHKKVVYHKESTENMTSLPDNYFDLVFCVATMEHIQNISAAFHEMARVCKKGGIVYSLSAPLWYSPYGNHREAFFKDYPWIHLLLSNSEIKEWFMKNMSEKMPDIAANIDGHINYLFGSGNKLFNKRKSSEYLDVCKNLGMKILDNHIDKYPVHMITEEVKIKLVPLYGEEELLGAAHWFVGKKI